MIALKYSPERQSEWDNFINQSRNATFLFYRNFMDYHKDRFEDCSLMLYNEKGKLIALFPATWDRENSTIKSHGGLTYGGLLISDKLGAIEVLSAIETILLQYKNMGGLKLHIKPIPHIYHLLPSEDELYSLFRKNAQLVSRGASSTVLLSQPFSFSKLRVRQAKKAKKMGCYIEEDGNLEGFWQILTETLIENHHVNPVHSYSEISLLKERFPNNIKCVTVLDTSQKIIGGTLLFCTPQVIHAQYIATNAYGKKIGALDLLFTYLLALYQFEFEQVGQPLYFDFGISTEDGGHYLNEGLIAQKEGFGAHTTIYDEYVIDLTQP